MKRIAALVFFAFLCATVVPAAAADGDKIIQFDTMAGVSGPFVGTANPIQGVGGGGLPWAIAEGRGELRTDGRLEVSVRGLVLAAGPSAGTNPIAQFKAIVSCRTIDGTGAPAILNVETGLFPATSAGDSDIEAIVTVPHPCLAPIVFVTNPAGRWFAITGF